MFSYYTIVTLIIILVWVLLFITKPEVRKEMIILGILALFVLPLAFTIQTGNEQQIQNLFSAISILDLLFSFSVAGIAGVIFHTFFGKHYHMMPQVKGKRIDKGLAEWWLLRLFFALLFLVWITLFLSISFDLPSSHALLISAVMLAIYIISHRHDLLVDSIVSGLLTALIVFIVVSLAGMFTATPIDIAFIETHTYFAGVPTELIIWSLALGIVLGPLYEYTRRIELS